MTASPPLPTAAALHYEPALGAPRVVAKGRGDIAKRIVAIARAAGVPVHASSELVALLMQVDLDRSIPEPLYRAVAEVLVWARELTDDGPGGRHG